MQVLKYGIFLVIGIAAQACGGGSDGDGGDGGDDDDSGGSSSGSGGSSNGGSSSGKGGTSGKGGSSSGGSATGGSSSGGSANGGSSSGGSANGGSSTGGTGGIDTTCDMAGYVSILSVPACKEFYTCYVETLCELSGQGQTCVDSTLASLKSSACYPEGTPLEMACAQAKAAYAAQPMFAECAN